MTARDDRTTDPVQLPVLPDRVRDAVLAELKRIEQQVGDLSSEQWSAPSAAVGWTVGDVVSHVNLALGLYTRLLGTAKEESKTGGLWKTIGDISKSMTPAVAPAFHAMNNAIPKLLDHTMSQESVKAQFASNVIKLRAKVEAIEGLDYSKRVNYVGGPWPVSFLLAGITNEVAVHSWDMASALDPQARLDFDARAVLPHFYWSGSPFMLRPPSGTTGSIQVQLSDPEIELWWHMAGKDSDQGSGMRENPDALISGDSSTFVLALAGRIKALDIARFQALEISGNESLARMFLDSWKIV